MSMRSSNTTLCLWVRQLQNEEPELSLECAMVTTQKSCTLETNWRQCIVNGGAKCAFLVPSDDQENCDIAPSTSEWLFHALKQTSRNLWILVLGVSFQQFAFFFFFWIAVFHSVLFLVTLTITDFDSFFHIFSVLQLAPGKCMLREVLSSYSAVKRTSCIRDSPSLSCVSLSPSFLLKCLYPLWSPTLCI